MVFGKLVSGSEKNEQTRQVADIRSRVLEEECGLKIEAEPEAFCMYALAYEGDTPVEILFQKVGFAEAGTWYEKEGRQWQPMQLQTGNIHKCCNCGQ